jgi:CheY-like chemotaxis protein
MRLVCNILHLEDDEDDAFLFERALANLQFTGNYRRVSNFLDATDYLTKSAASVDVLQYPMPDIFVTDGTTTIGALVTWLDQHRQFPQLVRFILTGGMCDAEKQKWMSRGFTSVLSKGGSLEDLTLAVKQILA